MLGILLKKQLMQFFRGYFYNARKNTGRSRASTVGLFVLFAAVIVFVLGGSFYSTALSLCAPLYSARLGWLYFAIMGLVALLLGAIGSVFTTYSSLYLAKDNDLLLSMPIPVKYIIASRLLGVYLMGLMYTSVVTIPTLIVRWNTAPATVITVLGGLLYALCISLTVLVLGCLLGWVVAKLSLRLKNKSAMTTLIALAFFALYYIVYFKAMNAVQDIVNNVSDFDGNVDGALRVLYLFGGCGEGDASAMLIVSAVTAALLALMWLLLKRSFISISTATGAVKKTVYREGRAVARSVDSALFSKELSRFTSSANYMLNCGFGCLMLLAGGVAILIKGAELSELVYELLAPAPGALPVIICAVICAILATVDIAATSVSLEGKNIWILQSLPLDAWHVLKAKLNVQLALGATPALFFVLCAALVLPFNTIEVLAMLLLCAAAALLMALWCMFLGVRMANLNWVNEVMPIKQSAAVFCSMIGGILYAGAIAVGFFALQPASSAAYMLLFSAVTLALSALLYLWLKKRGTQRFMEL